MQDLVTLGNGNSRFLKSVADFKTLYPTYDDFVTALMAGTLPVDFNGLNPDGIDQMGTPLNKKLFDHVIAAYGVTGGEATAYTLVGNGFVLTDGATIRFRLHATSGENPTINVNGTGAIPIMQDAKRPLKAGKEVGTWFTATYSEVLGFFVLQGSSGGTEGRFGNDPGQISTYQLAMQYRFNPIRITDNY